MKDDTELLKQFSDNESFRRWLADTIFRMTCEQTLIHQKEWRARRESNPRPSA
jgi:hypothetical protein